MALKLFLRVESQVDGQPPQVAGDYLFDRSAFGTQQPTYQYPTDPIRNFRRLIFVNPETQSELITFDAIPGDARNVVQVVSGDDDGGASHFVVDCAMRCRILDDSETLLLHAEIARMPEVKPSNLGFRSLRFKNSAGAGPEVCPHGGDFSSIRGKLDSLAQNPLTVSPVLAAGPSPVESQMHVQFAAGLVTLVRLDRGSHSFLAFKRMCQATPDRPLPFRIVQGNVMAYERPVDDAADMPAAESIVEFRIPGEAMRNSWNGQVQAPYVSALHTVQDGSPFSCMPFWTAPWPDAQATDDGDASDKNTWTLAVHGADSAQGSVLVTRALLPVIDIPASAQLATFLDHDGTPLAWSAKIPKQTVPGQRRSLYKPNPQPFSFEAVPPDVPPAGAGQNARLGALDLQFNGAPSADGQVSTFSVQFDQASGRPYVDVSMRFGLTDVQPGGEDDLPGEEFLAPNAQLGRPLVIPLESGPAQAGAAASYFLDFREQTQPRQSQAITLTLTRSDSAPAASERKVVVIDSQPFLVARVGISSFLQGADQTSQAGTWSNQSDSGARWQIAGGTDPFALLLPPQAVGEAMEKQHGDIPTTAPADFRFSPPASLSLTTTSLSQQFVEPAWNLRRLLGYPGEQAPGTPIVEADFELLYGLTCQITYGFLRLAEIASRLGNVPDATSAPPLPASFTPAQSKRFNDSFSAWQGTYDRYTRRLAVLEPWDTHQPAGLVLTDGLSYSLRKNASLKYPVGHGQHPPGVPDVADGLAGGFAWPFESQNIYNSLWRKPVSSSAKISNLYLSALGAWGFQKAAFNNDLTTIYSHTAMGRAHYISVERIGRLGVFWNTAKYVIVYERTVQQPGQFSHEQDALPGRAVLRKVREYVEILQPDRQYPEFGAAPITRGFVLGTHCKSLIVNVDGAWGSDVRAVTPSGAHEGWQVPLWNPSADAEFYPKPHILVEVAADPNTGRDSTMVELDEPQNLYFFTNTDDNATTQTDLWPALPGIDYADAWRTGPQAAFGGGTFDLPEDDPSIEPGFGRFTFAVVPGDRPVNLVRERTDNSLGTNLRTISMARSKPATSPPGVPAVASSGDLLSRVPDQVASAIDRLLLEAATAAKPEDIPDELFAQLDAPKGDLTKVATDVTNKINPGDIASQVRLQGQKTVELATAQITDTIVRGAHTLEQDCIGLIGTAAQWTATLQTSIKNEITAFADLQTDIEPLAASASTLLTNLNALSGVVAPFVSSVLAPLSGAPDPLTKNEIGVLQKIHALLLSGLPAFAAQLPPWASAWIGNRTDPILVAIGSADAALTNFEKNLQNGLTVVQKDVRVKFDVVAQLQAWFGKPKDDAVSQWLTKYAGMVTAMMAKGTPIDFLNALSQWVQQVEDAVQADLNAALNQLSIQVGNLAAGLAQFLSPSDTAASAVAQIATLLDLPASLKSNPDIVAFRQAVADAGKALAGQFGALSAYAASTLPTTTGFQLPDTTLRLLRAFGDPPRVPNLDFSGGSTADKARKALAYIFDENSLPVDISPVVARVFNGDDPIKSLGVALPSTQILDRLIPADLKNFDLSSIFPSFAGLQLTNLFPGLKLPDIANQNVRISHGVDQQTLRAWAEADINVPLDQAATLFSFGPVTLQLTSANFQASAKFAAGASGPPQYSVGGSIGGDWELSVGGTLIAIFAQTSLTFDNGGHVRFNISPENVHLQGVLTFIADALSSLVSPDSGFSIRLIPDPLSFASILDLPIPDIEFGAFGIANLRLGTTFSLAMVNNQFQLGAGLQVARQTAPFTLTIFILGGGGWLDVQTTYIPATGALQADVSVGITAGASLAIALGPISGGVYIYFGIIVEFHSNSSGLDIGVMLLISGQVNLLGIVDVSLSLMLEAEYSQGQLTGRGQLNISIKICWCFTLSINQSVQYRFAGGGGSSAPQQSTNQSVVGAGQPAPAQPATGQPAPARLTANDHASRYINALE